MTKKYRYVPFNLYFYKFNSSISLKDIEPLISEKFKTVIKDYPSSFVNSTEGYPISLLLSYTSIPLHINSIFSKPHSINNSYYFFRDSHATLTNITLPKLHNNITVDHITITIPFVYIEKDEEPTLTENGIKYKGRNLMQFIKPNKYLYLDEVYTSTLKEVYRNIELQKILK